MLPLAADRCVHGGIISGLRRRVPGIDLVTVEEAGLADNTPDPKVLGWAAREGRVLITQDWNTLIGPPRTVWRLDSRCREYSCAARV